MKVSYRLGRALFGLATSAQLWAATVALMGGQALLAATPAMACATEPYIGTVCSTAADYCPYGYFRADGKTLVVNQYQPLFAVIGFRYGGDNRDNFALPDLQGRSIAGVGPIPGTAAKLALAQKIGAGQVMLNSAQIAMPSHTHVATFTPTKGPFSTTIPATPNTLAVTSSLAMKLAPGVTAPPANTDGYYLGMGGTGQTQAPIYVAGTSTANTVNLGGLAVALTGTAGIPATPVTFDIVTGGSVVNQPASTVATQAVQTLSPVLGLTTCIAVLGIYPVRP